MTATRAHQQYGFDQMIERSSRVEQAMIEAPQIHETIQDIKETHYTDRPQVADKFHLSAAQSTLQILFPVQSIH